jgi:hypothetical protein
MLRESRATRDDSQPTGEHSGMQRFAIKYVLSQRRLHMWAVVLASSVELFMVVLFFVAVELVPDCYDIGHQSLRIQDFPMQYELAFAIGIAGCVFTFASIFSVLLSGDRSATLRQYTTLLSLITAPWMILTFAMYDHNTCTTVIPPAFLRCWMILRYSKTAIYSTNTLSKPVQAICVQVLIVTSVVVTCVGLMQVARSTESGRPSSFEENFYLTIVTLSTVGYGDVFPREYLGRVVAIIEIFVAMLMLPILTNDVTELIRYFDSQNAYRETMNHIIVVGTFTLEEALLLFRELLDADHKFAALHLVLLSPVEFDPAVRERVNTHELRNKVTLCVGNPRHTHELRRFAPRRADAAVFFSSSKAPAQRGDYRTILLSILFRRYDGQLPQYFMLKHTNHARILERSAFVIYDREALKNSLLGRSLRMQGFLSFFLNLNRPTSSDPYRRTIPGSTDNWFQLYADGARQGVYVATLPAEIEMRTFSSVALIMQLRVGSTLIGLVRNGKAVLNPAQVKVGVQDRLLMIAPSRHEVQDKLDRFTQLESTHEPTTVLLTPALTKPGVEVSPSMRHAANCYPFREHVVLIDVSSARTKFQLCDEEREEDEVFRADALLSLANHFPRTQSFVLISLDSITEQETSRWQADDRMPLFHLMGSPLDRNIIETACLNASRGVLIYSSEEGSESSVLRSTQLIVQRFVLDCLVGHDTPVIVVTEDVSDLPLFEPRLNSALPPEFAEDAKNVDVLSTAYAMSGVVTTTMLDALLLRTFYNEYLPQIVDQLLTPDVVCCERVDAYMQMYDGETASHRYAQLCRILSGLSRVPLGIARRVEDGILSSRARGRYTFFTNPPIALELRSSDRVFFIAPNNKYR